MFILSCLSFVCVYIYAKKAEYKDSCRSSNDCRIYAYFCGRSFLCECSYGFKPDAKNETCIGAIGTQCMYDAHCVLKAFCKDHKICSCKYEFPYVSDDQWTCYGTYCYRFLKIYNFLLLLYRTQQKQIDQIIVCVPHIRLYF